ncbi:URC4/urg3 family protein [Acuticoccus sp. M5D2P5]|uniref:URC4/urg3 family protein n=1 Tax=Acuticoccus kalidii TaxID=2910977 RepID=UPI001F34287F|nr:URC4/urg3 family protein [Acuticoccus kalidii]MCF3932439.1 URC4/urg3 family protein [Acuticoccus kalidii]
MIEDDRAGEETPDEATLETVRWLLSADAIRTRAGEVTARIDDGASAYFTLDRDRLGALADSVAELTRERFPDLAVPFHSRWRHFEAAGYDRFASLAAAREWSTPEEAARAMGDLAIVSVLLDAGAGPTWRYHEAVTGEVMGRSEGLALASFAMFASGAFSAVPADPLRADAAGLEDVSEAEFAQGFQITEDNPLAGADGRRDLLRELAFALRMSPDIFAVEDDPRPGGIIDALAAEAEDGELPAPKILEAVLEGLGPIWPSRESLAGIPLGDTWRYEPLDRGTPGSDLVPFHKLSSWLSYSLIEPLTVRGIVVTDIDGLTGLAEYRNGGLFVDGGALVLRDPAMGKTPLPVSHPLVVEWRAATVTLLDALAPMVRERLGVSAETLPLASILEGGTWLAGRKLAQSLRADASPPIAIESDGTVF